MENINIDTLKKGCFFKCLSLGKIHNTVYIIIGYNTYHSLKHSLCIYLKQKKKTKIGKLKKTFRYFWNKATFLFNTFHHSDNGFRSIRVVQNKKRVKFKMLGF